jgi:hypothetical protein
MKAAKEMKEKMDARPLTLEKLKQENECVIDWLRQ